MEDINYNYNTFLITNEIIRKKLNILIVDDDINMSIFLKEILEIRGHAVQIINDAIRCISVCENTYFDIVLMDYHMEGLNGSEITYILREKPNYYNNKILIFAFTGDSSNIALKQFRSANMNGAIIKPIDVKMIDLFFDYLEIHNELDINHINYITKISNKNILFF